jgi:group I intron endonuclease
MRALTTTTCAEVIMADGIVCPSGVYKIHHVDSGRAYIGSAVSLRARLLRHKNELSRGIHTNSKLQRAWNKYGEESFLFSVVEYVADKDQLTAREQAWIDAECAAERGFNICPTAGSILGTKRPPHVIAKVIATHLGSKRSEATKALIREARARQAPLSVEGRAKLAAATAARIVTPETRAKLSAASTGRKMSPEVVEANRQRQIGKRLAPETKEKLRVLNIGRKHSAESRAKMSAWQIGRKMSPEAIAKSIAARSGYRASEETRKKLSDAGKGKPKTLEHRIKIGLSQIGKNVSAETRRKIGVASSGRVFSADSIAKRVATRAANRALGLHSQ